MLPIYYNKKDKNQNQPEKMHSMRFPLPLKSGCIFLPDSSLCNSTHRQAPADQGNSLELLCLEFLLGLPHVDVIHRIIGQNEEFSLWLLEPDCTMTQSPNLLIKWLVFQV